MTARLAICLLLATLPACGKFQQAKECNALAKLVNSFIAENAAIKRSNSNDAAQIAKENQEFAARYERFASDLGALHIESAALAGHVNNYRGIAQKAAATLREVATALSNGNPELAREKRIEFDTAARAEAPLVQQINALCH